MIAYNLSTNKTNLIMNVIHNIFLMSITKPAKEAVLKTEYRRSEYKILNDINQCHALML